MQVYRGMDIGTAKPSAAEQAEISHHLIDLVDPSEEFSLAEFQAAAFAVLDDIERRDKRALLVGGTGLYLQAVVDRLELPGQFSQVRQELESIEDVSALHERLQVLDPLAASRIEPDNKRRLVRALEVTIGSRRPFSSYGPGIDVYAPTPFRLIGVWLPRPESATRIDRRISEMLEAGWLAETRRLLERGPLSKTAAQALGYRELIAHLSGLSLDEAVGEISRRTRSFARRQRVWFRRDPRIQWLATSTDPRRLLPAVLQDLGGE